MVRGDTVLLDSTEVFGGRVAFVAVPAVEGVFTVQLRHQLIAVSFCQNAGGGDGHESGVAFDEALVGVGGLIVESVAVDEQELGLWVELHGGEAHGVG